jgi:serine/threonine protein kinase
VCKALDYLHERPILHRDLSWGNIMFKADPRTGQMLAKACERKGGGGVD